MNSSDFSTELKPFEDFFGGILKESVLPPASALTDFWQGMEYSLFGGGKRFRPLLSLLTAKSLGQGPEAVYPFAASVEMIHTYSLIHDDLPALDNDDLRRGRATHHKVYGEDMALLAGDALQTLAFQVVADHYREHPQVAEIVSGLARAAGPRGMVGGQVLDMLADRHAPTQKELELIHKLKTGALISISVVGAALVCEASQARLQPLKRFGDILGLAFQIADDIQDAQEGEDSKNFVALLGEEKTKEWLQTLSGEALSCLSQLPGDTSGLESLVKFNVERV